MSSRSKILLAASDLFYRNGFRATSVDDLLSQAKVSKSNFYYHFKNKEELGIAVLESRREELQATIELTLGNRLLTPRERLLRYFELLSELRRSRFGNGGCPFGNLVAEMSDHSERFRCMLNEMFSGLANRISELVAEGQLAGEFRKEINPGDMAALILHAAQGMHILAKCEKSVDKIDRAAFLLITLMKAA